MMRPFELYRNLSNVTMCSAFKMTEEISVRYRFVNPVNKLDVMNSPAAGMM